MYFNYTVNLITLAANFEIYLGNLEVTIESRGIAEDSDLVAVPFDVMVDSVNDFVAALDVSYSQFEKRSH